MIKLVAFKYVEKFSWNNCSTKLCQAQREHFWDENSEIFCQNVPASSCFTRMCLGTWFPVPALCGGLLTHFMGDLLVNNLRNILADISGDSLAVVCVHGVAEHSQYLQMDKHKF